MATNQGQIDIFEAARKPIAHELSERLRACDFAGMLRFLDEAAEIHGKGRNHSDKIRNFSRSTLGLRGVTFVRAVKWLKGETPMTADDVVLVLKTLTALCNRPATVAKPTVQSPKGPSGATAIKRKVIEHNISMFNSILGLVIQSEIGAGDVFDGDRMQITRAVQRICEAMGIPVVFPESKHNRNRPATGADMKGML